MEEPRAEALEPRALAPGERRLPGAAVRSWRERGFALVSGLVDDALVDALHAFGSARFPAAGSAAAEEISDFGSSLDFPQGDPAFDGLVLHPSLLDAAAMLLGIGVAGLRLSQAVLWAKYGRSERRGGRFDNQDQRIHVDYPNHTLAHPAPWDRPEAVEMIVYLDDGARCGGATAVVPREGPDDPAYAWPLVASPGIGSFPWINDREAAEARIATDRPEWVALRRSLYARERTVAYRRGTVLLYRHDTWHRGTPMHPATRRLAVNLTFRRAEAEWISMLQPGWAWRMYRPDQRMERLVAGASLDQRAVLGFPQPGDPYWCEETVAAVEARYGAFGFDGAPYRLASAQAPARRS